LACSCAQWRTLLKEEGREELTMLLSRVEMLDRLPPLLSWPEPGCLLRRRQDPLWRSVT
jgi:hypothetical protein